jgi:hypothetical protein
LRTQNVDADAPANKLADEENLKAKQPKAARNVGRRSAPYWAKYEQVILERLQEDGYPERGDGGQARLEKVVGEMMAVDGIEPLPSESTIRVHVHQCIARYRDNPIL